MARVLVQCPVRERPAPTGYWMNPTQFAAAGARYAFRCAACGEIHQWMREDAWLEGTIPPAKAPPAKAAADPVAGPAE